MLPTNPAALYSYKLPCLCTTNGMLAEKKKNLTQQFILKMETQNYSEYPLKRKYRTLQLLLRGSDTKHQIFVVGNMQSAV